MRRRAEKIGDLERAELVREGEAFAQTLARAYPVGDLAPWIERAEADVQDARKRSSGRDRAAAIARRELVYKPVLLERLRQIADRRRRGSDRSDRHEGERGFTLPELLATIAILGILLAIGIIILLGILEAWRVDAATNQLKADMRLAHTSATNRLTDYRIVLVPERANENQGPDYHLVRLAAPYPGTPPVVVGARPHTFPGDVQVVNIAGALDRGGGWTAPPTQAGRTRTLEFNSDGAMKFYQAVSGSTCVTVDGDPENRVTVIAATSRVRVRPGAC